MLQDERPSGFTDVEIATMYEKYKTGEETRCPLCQGPMRSEGLHLESYIDAAWFRCDRCRRAGTHKVPRFKPSIHYLRRTGSFSPAV
jgi:tRNA(Ile2) C34 agmatinyltransferase TiaS